MNAPQCALRSAGTQAAAQSADFKRRSPTLCLFELRVPLDKLLRAASGEAHGYAAVVVVALDADDGSAPEPRMTNFAPQHGIGIPAPFPTAPPERTLSRPAPPTFPSLLRPSPHP